jgi:CO dehydrogenase nickel-insertion accessory protein CooC1
MEDVARVVLALEAPEVIEEIMHFLDRSGRARVVATAVDDRQLVEAVQQLEPDAVVAEPGLALAGIETGTLLALATRETVASLRAAVRAGARGFFVWPEEREGLLDGVAGTLAVRRTVARRARVVAMHASRGGAGCTFVASHLAAAIARHGSSCVLVDADLTYGDLSPALGVPDDARTVAELASLGDELGWTHVEDVGWRHEAGLLALLAPAVEALGATGPQLVVRAVEAAATGADAVVVSLPRAVDEVTRGCAALADLVLEVLTLDVLSFRASTRALELLSPLGVDGRVEFVVNRAARAEIAPGDVQRVFGRPPLTVVAADGAVSRAQDHGHLLPRRGRVARAMDRVAARVLEPASSGEEAA